MAGVFLITALPTITVLLTITALRTSAAFFIQHRHQFAAEFRRRGQRLRIDHRLVEYIKCVNFTRGHAQQNLLTPHVHYHDALPCAQRQSRDNFYGLLLHEQTALAKAPQQPGQSEDQYDDQQQTNGHAEQVAAGTHYRCGGLRTLSVSPVGQRQSYGAQPKQAAPEDVWHWNSKYDFWYWRRGAGTGLNAVF